MAVEKDYYKSFKRLVSARGYSLGEMAELLELTRPGLESAVSVGDGIKYRNIKRLSLALGISPEEFETIVFGIDTGQDEKSIEERLQSIRQVNRETELEFLRFLYDNREKLRDLLA